MLTDNLVAYWKLDESSGNPADSSGNGYTLTNTNTVGFAACKINNGGQFGDANTNKYFTIASTLGLGNYQADIYSVSCWAYIETQPSNNAQAPWGLGVQAKLQSNFNYADVSGTKKLLYIMYSGSVQILEWNQAMTTDTWHHLVFVKNGTTCTLYFDGSSLGNNTITLANASPNRANQFAVGRNAYDNDQFWKGQIDEVGVWSRALSSDEITALYNGGNGLTHPFTNTKSINSLYKRSIKTS